MKRNKTFSRAAAVLAVLLLVGCGSRAPSDTMNPPTPTPTAAPTPEPTEPPPPDPAVELLSAMTVREKVGQLFVVRPDSLDLSQTQEQIDDPKAEGVTVWDDTLRAVQADYPVGGFALFKKNLTDPEQLMALNAALMDGSATAPLLAMDEEGGLVARIANHKEFEVPQYESATAVGDTGDPAAAREMGRSIGTYLKEYGLNLDFAPDADVNSNPDNPVIGTRAFSEDPAVAAEMVAAAVEGFHEAGMLCTIKHFPGHGDTAEDSHFDTARSEKTWEEMQACELLPFEAGINAGADCVMVAHIVTPNATDDELPATLSKTMLTDRLRGELGFGGVIVTDSLAMEAITDHYSSVEACKMALDAGADILLMPTDFTATYDGLVAAVENGEISEERLNESVLRIIRLKQAAGLL